MCSGWNSSTNGCRRSTSITCSLGMVGVLRTAGPRRPAKVYCGRVRRYALTQTLRDARRARRGRAGGPVSPVGITPPDGGRRSRASRRWPGGSSRSWPRSCRKTGSTTRPRGLRPCSINGFLQMRMIARDWKPGLMHAAIFAGFMGLLVRKIQLIVIGYHEPFTYAGVFGAAFAAGKDVIEILLLVALAYAFWRRYVRPPARLEPNREALLILSLITAIVVTDLLFDGFRFVLYADSDAGIAHERDFAFAGRAIAGCVRRPVAGRAPRRVRRVVLDPGRRRVRVPRAAADRRALPHRDGAARALLPSRPSGQRACRPSTWSAVFADDADPPTRSAWACARAADLTWKEGLDAFTCTECGRCKDACPTFLTGKPLSQKWVHDSVKHHLLAQRAAIVGGAGPRRAAAAGARRDRRGHAVGVHDLRLLRGRVPDRARAPAALLPDAPAPRADGRRVPARAEGGLRRVRGAEQPVGLRGRHARRLGGRPRRARRDERRRCGGTRLPVLRRLGRVVRPARAADRARLVAILRHAGVRFGILGAARDVDRRMRAPRSATRCCSRRWRRRWSRPSTDTGVTRIVTCDPHAFNSLTNEYPEFGGPLGSAAPHAADRAPARGRPHPRRSPRSSA